MLTFSNDTEATWESHKSTILNLYFTENMTLEKVMEHMRQNHGFESLVTPLRNLMAGPVRSPCAGVTATGGDP